MTTLSGNQIPLIPNLAPPVRFGRAIKLPPWKNRSGAPRARTIRGHRHHYVHLTCPHCLNMITSEARVANTFTQLRRWLRRAMHVELYFSTKRALKMEAEWSRLGQRVLEVR